MTLYLNGEEVEFCIDTGAEVSAISEQTHESIGSPSLQPLDKELKGPNNAHLDSIGRFKGQLQKGDRKTEQEIYVMRNLHRPLLGRPAIEKLQILAMIGSVENSPSYHIVDKFAHLFRGLGKLEGQYTIIINTHKRFAIAFLPLLTTHLSTGLFEAVFIEKSSG